MKTENADRLIDYLLSEGYDATLYEDYSGRGMFGATTTGVVTDAHPSSIGSITRRAGVSDNVRSDNMGLSYIYY